MKSRSIPSGSRRTVVNFDISSSSVSRLQSPPGSHSFRANLAFSILLDNRIDSTAHSIGTSRLMVVDVGRVRPDS
jgi:hypothetical protein